MKIPKYQVIKNELKKQLTSGKFENGDKFYTEAELAKMFQVSSITVIRALNDLVMEGYLTRYQGRGTFVSRARKGKLIRFSDVENFPFDLEEVVVLSITRDNQLRILNHLKLKKNDYYYRIERVRKVGGQIYHYQISYLPEQFINPNYPDLSYYNSIYQRLKTDYNIHLADESFEETNEILLPMPEKVAEYLECDVNTPVLMQVRKTYNKDSQQVFEYIESYKRWDFFKIKLTSE